MGWIRERNCSGRKLDLYWRASRIATCLLPRKDWSECDRRLASLLLDEHGVEERLIEHALARLES